MGLPTAFFVKFAIQKETTKLQDNNKKAQFFLRTVLPVSVRGLGLVCQIWATTRLLCSGFRVEKLRGIASRVAPRLALRFVPVLVASCRSAPLSKVGGGGAWT